MGYPVALYELSLFYFGDDVFENYHGILLTSGRHIDSIKEDYEKAIGLLQTASQLNVVDASLALGMMYLFGIGVERDDKKAFEYAKKDAKEGDNALNDWFLSNLYFEGKGTEKDLKKAFYWAKEAAKQGIDEAKRRVAECYKEGWGVKKDSAKVNEWIKRNERKRGDS